MGGAIFDLFGNVTIDDSTLSTNNAVGGASSGYGGAGLGGAIFNVDGVVTLSGATVASNSVAGSPTDDFAINGNAGADGSAIYSVADGHTISSGGATSAQVTLANSIVFGNAGGDDISLLQLGGGNASSLALASASDVGSTQTQHGATASGAPLATDPELGPLQVNGSGPGTMEPVLGSPVIGAGQSCDPSDERGVARPANGCDLGAFETVGSSTSLASSVNPSSVGQTVTYTATVSPGASGGAVAFSDNGTAISGCAGVALDTTTGAAVCSTNFAMAGEYPIVATYSGQGEERGSTSGTLTQTVAGTPTGAAATALRLVSCESRANGSIVVRVALPGAGEVRARVESADGWDRASKAAADAETLGLTLHPEHRATKLLRRDRRLGKPLDVAVVVTYTPPVGASSQVGTTVRLLKIRRGWRLGSYQR
jgi:hypothetical protein